MAALSKPKILMVASEYAPRLYGGLGRHVTEITKALEPYADILLLLPEGAVYEPLSPNVIVYTAPALGATEVDYWLHFARAAVQCVERWRLRFDLVHCHDWMTALAGVRLARDHRRPFVLNIHLPQFAAITRFVEDLGIKNADLTIVNTHAIAAELNEGPRSSRATVIANGVDHEIFCPLPDSSKRGSKYIMYCGRFSSQKGVETLLQAMAVLLSKRIRVPLLVVGDGPLGLYFRRLSQFLGLSELVTFLDWQSTDALVKLYRGATAVVVPSIYEPFGLVALEAMACGSVALGSAVKGLAELFSEPSELRDCLFAPGNHLQLAEKLLFLLRNEPKRKRLAELSLERSARYSWHRAAKELAVHYGSLVGGTWQRESRNDPLHFDAFQVPAGARTRELIEELSHGADRRISYQPPRTRDHHMAVYERTMKAEIFYQPEQELLAHQISLQLRRTIHPAIDVHLTQVDLVSEDSGTNMLALLNRYAQLLQASISPTTGLKLTAGIYEHFGYRVYLAVYLTGYLLPSRNLQTDEQLRRLFPAVALRGRMVMIPSGLEQTIGSDEALSPFRPLEMGGVVEVDFMSEASIKKGVAEAFDVFSHDVLDEARAYARYSISMSSRELNLEGLEAALNLSRDVLVRIIDRSGVDPVNDFVHVSLKRKVIHMGQFTKLEFKVQNRSAEARDVVLSLRGPVECAPARVRVTLPANETVVVPLSISPKETGEFPLELLLSGLEEEQIQGLLSPHHFWIRVRSRPRAH